MNIHFIAIGGAIMHNMALALHRKGYQISGSDDHIFDPSRSRLEAEGLLPAEFGFFADRIHDGLDAVVLGMHARKDNVELRKAMELGIPVHSFPAYVYEQCKEQQRVVIAGSHGKTTITSMIMHALGYHGRDFNYLVGSAIEGFELSVRLDDGCDTVILEGDEYLSSPLDPEPKFIHYRPQLALLTGIAWDHMNVFPTFESYVMQFRKLLEVMTEGACLVYNEEDPEIAKLVKAYEQDRPGRLRFIPYGIPDYRVENGRSLLRHEGSEYLLNIFGRHNLQNLLGASLICAEMGMDSADFFHAMQSFSGAARRLQLVRSDGQVSVYNDFAHSPSKLKATVDAVHELYPERPLLACMELHTYSSLNRDFLPQYRDCMQGAEQAVVYFNPDNFSRKRLEPFGEAEVRDAFGQDGLLVFTDSQKLEEWVLSQDWNSRNLLWMTSGDFDGLDIDRIAARILS